MRLPIISAPCQRSAIIRKSTGTASVSTMVTAHTATCSIHARRGRRYRSSNRVSHRRAPARRWRTAGRAAPTAARRGAPLTEPVVAHGPQAQQQQQRHQYAERYAENGALSTHVPEPAPERQRHDRRPHGPVDFPPRAAPRQVVDGERSAKNNGTRARPLNRSPSLQSSS